MAASGSTAMSMRDQTRDHEKKWQLHSASNGRLKLRVSKSKRKDFFQLDIMNKTLKILPLGGRTLIVDRLAC